MHAVNNSDLGTKNENYESDLITRYLVLMLLVALPQGNELEQDIEIQFLARFQTPAIVAHRLFIHLLCTDAGWG